jgi:vanillate/4-hydroxybenzoate decarboxylase subunit D
MICPRCDGDQAYKVRDADDGSWEVYRCPQCSFNWRSTEGEAVTDPKMYSPKFKLTEKKIEEMAPKPPIPPLRTLKAT